LQQSSRSNTNKSNEDSKNSFHYLVFRNFGFKTQKYLQKTCCRRKKLSERNKQKTEEALFKKK